MDIEIIEKEFDKGLIKTRRGKAGAELSYVETSEYIKRLNQAFDYNWSFEVTEGKVEEGFVAVKGKLTAEGIVKMQYGTSQMTVGRQNGEMLNLGDDYKAATSDALKKCCSLFGIGLHLYNGSGGNGPGTRQTGMNTATANKGNGRITKEQLARIRELRTKLGKQPEYVLGIVQRMFNTKDIQSINAEMAKALISVLEKETGKGNNHQGEVI